MKITNSINFINFKSQIPFYYPRGRNVDRAEILAREAEYRQILEEGDGDIFEEGPLEPLSEAEVDAKLRELEAIRSQINIGPFVPSEDESKEDAPKAPLMPVFQTEEVLFEEERKLDLRG